ncbi:MAG TPA: isochorismatase family protein, partial [Caldimonas sp.]|nr:isochorismatase family protein [Caldimonas sp.]
MAILCNPQDSTLLVVDTQTRLMPAIHEGENVVRRCVMLATAAHELGIHVIGTEENPEGLGPLVPEVAALCDTTLAKYHFSAPREEGFLRRLPAGRDTLVVAGCEAHVCV